MNQGKCAACKVAKKVCRVPDGQGPAFCSTKLYADALAKAAAEYEKPEIHGFARQASVQEAECYIDRTAQPPYRFPVKPRIQELIEFSRKMGYRKLGLAFCGGLHHEADIASRILEDHGFEVVSVVCKVGGVDKGAIGVGPAERVRIGAFEPMCNPIAQAEILNAAGTDFNILLGLCVGHDSLFIKYSKPMVTVFAVKDRVLGHNPLAAIYTYDSYYERFKQDRLKDLTVKGQGEEINDKQ
jgi:uncharacterized metal-binding protein